MDETKAPISFLCMCEGKRAALERLGDTIIDRQLLVLSLSALPDIYCVETTKHEAALDLDRSIIEGLIGAGYRNSNERGEIRLVMTRPEVKRNKGRGARNKGARSTKSSD